MKNLNLNNKLTPLLTLALIVSSFFLGSFSTKIKIVEQGGSLSGSSNQKQAEATPSTQPSKPEVTKGVSSIDDDPIMGDKDAPITIIEFSDYECPFCKRYFDNTLPQIKEKYVDTGKVKLVYRDLPLSFHEPMATKEAVAANCARQQGGDSKYFEYHDQIFTRTKSNGNGLSESDLTTIAKDLNLNLSDFASCQQDENQLNEVKKDIADAEKAGASGTPTFVIGKSQADGKVDGQLLVGAQPFSAFETILKTLE